MVVDRVGGRDMESPDVMAMFAMQGRVRQAAACKTDGGAHGLSADRLASRSYQSFSCVLCKFLMLKMYGVNYQGSRLGVKFVLGSSSRSPMNLREIASFPPFIGPYKYFTVRYKKIFGEKADKNQIPPCVYRLRQGVRKRESAGFLMALQHDP